MLGSLVLLMVLMFITAAAIASSEDLDTAEFAIFPLLTGFAIVGHLIHLSGIKDTPAKLHVSTKATKYEECISR
ncbi:MAG: hypothetical protein Kow0069_02410 [Promethearchaeota archaeon]